MNRDRVVRIGSLGPGRPIAAVGSPRSPLALGIGPGPVVSCRTLIFRKRPLLEQLRHVATADVHLPQSLELNDGKLAHDRLGCRSRDAELSLEGLRIEEFRQGDCHAGSSSSAKGRSRRTSFAPRGPENPAA